MRVLATASATTIPFGAFGHLMDGDHRSPGLVIPRFVTMLRTRFDGRPPTVVVDDAHLLDGGSAALVLALATTGAARLVVTLRSLEQTPDAITALWKERGLERIELQPLGRRDVRRLVGLLLDGPVTAAALERIHELSQGNPLFVHELVRDARSTGALHRVDDRWHWREELVAFDRLRGLVERRAEDASDAARAALELVAVGAPLPYAVLSELSSPEAVEELELLGVIAIHGTAREAEVRASHPLFGEVVAARLPVTTAMRLRRRLAVALGRRSRIDDADRLRVAVWLLDAGECDSERFTEPSRLAMERGDPELALRLAQAAGDGFDAAVAVAVALNALVCFEAVEAVLAPHEAAAAGLDEASAAAYLETRFRALLRGSELAAEALVDRAAHWHQGAGWDPVIATQRGWAQLYRSRPTVALAIVEASLAVDELEPLRRFHLLSVAILAHARLGRTDDCLRSAAAIRALVAHVGQMPWETRWATLMFEAVPRIEAGRDLAGVEVELRAALAEATALGDRSLRPPPALRWAWPHCSAGISPRPAPNSSRRSMPPRAPTRSTSSWGDSSRWRVRTRSPVTCPQQSASWPRRTREAARSPASPHAWSSSTSMRARSWKARADGPRQPLRG